MLPNLLKPIAAQFTQMYPAKHGMIARQSTVTKASDTTAVCRTLK